MEKLIEKLRKLLALGQSPNPAEAEAAIQKAQELAIKNGIDLMKLPVADPNQSSVTKDELTEGKRLPIAATFVFPILTEFFNVKIILSGGRYSGRSVIFIGKPEDVATAKFVYNFLVEAMETAWLKHYNKGNNFILLSAKHGFFSGFRHGLAAKLAANKTKIAASLNDSDKNFYQLAIIDTSKKIELFVKKEFPRLKTSTRRLNSDTSGYSSGYSEGQRCEIHRGHLA